MLTAAAQDPVRTAAFVSKEYIPQDLCPPKTMADAMETTAAPELSPLEKALAGMDAETRTIFEARFGELMGKIQTLETNGLEAQGELTKQLEAAKAEVESAKESQSAAKTNNAILAMQVCSSPARGAGFPFGRCARVAHSVCRWSSFCRGTFRTRVHWERWSRARSAR